MMTAAQSLLRFRAEQGLDPVYDTAPTWPFTVGPVTIAVPNFSWRRAAIQRHDLHHLITGYPFNMRGEYQVATWEFAAGRYPHAGAILLLLPLVVLGLCWSPRAIWHAFLRGRRATSLFQPALRDAYLRLPLDQLVARSRGVADTGATFGDVAAFAVLVAQSAAVILAAPAALLLALLAI